MLPLRRPINSIPKKAEVIDFVLQRQLPDRPPPARFCIGRVAMSALCMLCVYGALRIRRNLARVLSRPLSAGSGLDCLGVLSWRDFLYPGVTCSVALPRLFFVPSRHPRAFGVGSVIGVLFLFSFRFQVLSNGTFSRRDLAGVAPGYASRTSSSSFNPRFRVRAVLA